MKRALFSGLLYLVSSGTMACVEFGQRYCPTDGCPSPPPPKPVLYLTGPAEVDVGEVARFSAAGSYNPSGTEFYPFWEFGTYPPCVEKGDLYRQRIYTKAGDYTVTLQAGDRNSGWASKRLKVKVRAPSIPAPKNLKIASSKYTNGIAVLKLWFTPSEGTNIKKYKAYYCVQKDCVPNIPVYSFTWAGEPVVSAPGRAEIRHKCDWTDTSCWMASPPMFRVNVRAVDSRNYEGLPSNTVTYSP